MFRLHFSTILQSICFRERERERSCCLLSIHFGRVRDYASEGE
jgi:hypothetical protein